MSKRTEVHLEIPGREEIHLIVETDASGKILSSSLTGVGNLQFLQELAEARKSLTGCLAEVKAPVGTHTSALLIREAILRSQGAWQLPYDEDEVCHCRMVSTEKIRHAILVGAHTAEQVSAQTSASTACGTCRPNVEAILDYFLTARHSSEPA